MSSKKPTDLILIFVLPLFVLSGILFVLGGMLIGIWIGNSPIYHNTKSEMLSDEWLSKVSFTQVLPTMDILVRLIPRDQFEAEAIAGGALPAPGVMPLAFAQAAHGPYPCRVTLPAGMAVVAYPHDAAAYFKPRIGNADDDVFAHEFLHCIYPNWHEPWTSHAKEYYEHLKEKPYVDTED